MLSRVRMAVGELNAADLQATALRTANILERTQPKEGTPHLVHGTLYARHIFDMGDGPGVIDWQQFGRGPLEVDAGMFLATISRTALRHKEDAEEARRATEEFLEGIRDLVDPKSLEWYWAASLLRLSVRGMNTKLGPRPLLSIRPVVVEAAKRAEHLVSGRAL